MLSRNEIHNRVKKKESNYEFILYNSLNNGLEIKTVNILFEMKYIVLGIKGDFYFLMCLFFPEFEKNRSW